MPTMTPGVFWGTFRDPEDRIGHDLSDHESTTFYARCSDAVGGTEKVGEARQCRRSTRTVYSLLIGEVAQMVLYWYRVKPLEDRYADICACINTARALGERAVKLGCNLSSLHDAIGHLASAQQTLLAGKSSKGKATPIPPTIQNPTKSFPTS